MAFFSFGKKIRHRRFDYIPRYYDQDKEELEARLEKYNRKPGNIELSKQRIRGGFKRKYSVNSDYSKKTVQRSNRILLIVIGVLLMLTYLFITEYMPKIVAAFE